ncbi:MAG: RagB/SusD family nutrient uptake outer membrane protein [Cyclobacteriaceae bacterium]|nr:RagB/SusD family nutrient uptake outer membrane protein [Cyclobacteriaceae bacterium]
MKNRLIKIFTIILAFSISSCEDVLDRVPLDAPSDLTFFSNQQELELAINGVYQNLYLMSAGATAQNILDNATDLGWQRALLFGIEALTLGAHNAETGLFASFWQHQYRGVNRSNNLLQNMHRARAVVSESFYNRIEAEAKFLRAYHYFWLIQMYGDVPYVTEIPSSIAEGIVPRTPKSTIVDNLFTDLDFAAANLPDSWGGANEGRATRGAALALKSRIALMNNRYNEAIQAAQQVMQSNVYDLYPDYGDLFIYEGERSQEVILDLPFLIGVIVNAVPREQGPRNIGGFSRLAPSQYMIDSYECVDGLTIDKSPLYDPSNPFANRDPRLHASVILPQTMFGTYVFETTPDSTVTTRIVGGVASRVNNQDVTNPFATFTGYLWRKGTSEADVPDNRALSQLNYILIRYAEVLLNYAEAKIESGQIDNTVLTALNRIRARAYGVDVAQTELYPAITTTDQAELRTILRRERKIELANEGFRFLDLYRWGIAEHVLNGPLVGRPLRSHSTMTFVPTIDQYGQPRYDGGLQNYRQVLQMRFDAPKDYLWPIPQRELDINSELVQNPNY